MTTARLKTDLAALCPTADPAALKRIFDRIDGEVRAARDDGYSKASKRAFAALGPRPRGWWRGGYHARIVAQLSEALCARYEP